MSLILNSVSQRRRSECWQTLLHVTLYKHPYPYCCEKDIHQRSYDLSITKNSVKNFYFQLEVHTRAGEKPMIVTENRRLKQTRSQ